MKKICCKCKRELDLNRNNFPERDGVADGYFPYCRDCHSIQQQNYYARNRQKVLDKQRNKNRSTKNPSIQEAYRNTVHNILKKEGHFNNNVLAKKTGACYTFILQERERLEQSGEIPFAKVLQDSNGKWRRRFIRKNKLKNDPFGKQDIIYFVRHGGKNERPIKIGRTKHFAQRLACLSVSNPYALEILAVIPGNRQKEWEIHNELKEYRMRGEWFSDDSIVLEFIEKIRSNPENNLSQWAEYKKEIEDRE